MVGNLLKMKERRIQLKGSYSDKIFDALNVIIMILLLFIFVYPLYFVVIASFSDPKLVTTGQVILWPKGISLDSYKEMMKETKLWIGYKNTIFVTIVGTLINMILTVLCAYPLSRKDWLPKGFFMKMLLIAMYFNGGLIPTFLVVKRVGLLDTIWAMIIPSAISFYNCLIVRNYFMNSIPPSLQEAAELDGANPAQYLIRIVLPLSKPVLAVVALYYAVGHWNDYYSALIYIFDTDLKPLQTALREILMSSQLVIERMNQSTLDMDAETFEKSMAMAETMKYSVIIVALVPMLLVYPFVQKYFVKGVMIGAIKG